MAELGAENIGVGGSWGKIPPGFVLDVEISLSYLPSLSAVA